MNAAGLGADAVDRLFGFDRFTVTPRRGELLVFDKQARPLVNRIVLPVPTKLGKGVLVSPTIYGNVMLGPTAEDLPDKTATGTSEAGFEFLLRKGEKLIPDLLSEEVTASYAGLRAAINRDDYLIEADQDRRYLLVAGIRSTGLTSAMADRRARPRPARPGPAGPGTARADCPTPADAEHRRELHRAPTRTPPGSPPTPPTAASSASANASPPARSATRTAHPSRRATSTACAAAPGP